MIPSRENILFRDLRQASDLSGFYAKGNRQGTTYRIEYSSSYAKHFWLKIKSIFLFKNYYVGKDIGKISVNNSNKIFSDKARQIAKRKLQKKGIHRIVDQEAILKSPGKVSLVEAEGPFYHATKSPKILKAIFSSGEVKVMHNGAYRGAFVSQQPEYERYGNYVLVFYDNIKKHKDDSPRAHLQCFRNISNNSSPHQYAWIGFGTRLPINSRYLAGVILNLNYVKNPEKERKKLKKELCKLAGRKITVELSSNLQALRPSALRGI